MTSAEKISSNRNNAKKSTGPRTESGKRRTSRNALRHGLTTFSPEHPSVSAEIERIAKFICPDTNSPAYEHALTIAECEIILRQVRAARVTIFERPPQSDKPRRLLPDFPTNEEFLEGLEELARGRARLLAKRLKQAGDSVRAFAKRMKSNGSNLPTTAQASNTDTASNTPPERANEQLRRGLLQLVRLDRYAKSAFSRRKRAIDHFIASSLVDAALRRCQTKLSA